MVPVSVAELKEHIGFLRAVHIASGAWRAKRHKKLAAEARQQLGGAAEEPQGAALDAAR